MKGRVSESESEVTSAREKCLWSVAPSRFYRWSNNYLQSLYTCGIFTLITSICMLHFIVLLGISS